MQLLHTHIKGLGPLVDVEIDWQSLGAGEIAIVGRTGEGKTHALEATCIAGIYRKMPYYDNVKTADHMTPGGLVENTYRFDEHGDVTFRLYKSKSRETAEIVVNGNVIGPSVSVYDAEVAKIVPSKEFLEAGPFAVQKGQGSLFLLKPEIRRQLFDEMIGAAKYKAWAMGAKRKAEQAAGEANAIQQSIETIRAALARKQGLQDEVDSYQEQLDAHRSLEEGFKLTVESVRTKLASLREEAARVEQESFGKKKQLKEIRDEMAAISKRIADLEKAIATAPAGEIPDDDLEAELHEVVTTKNTKQEYLSGVRGALKQATEQWTEANGEAYGFQTRIDTLQNEIEKMEQNLSSRKDSLRELLGGVEKVDLSIDMCRRCPLTESGRNAKDQLARLANEVHESVQVAVAAKQELEPQFKIWREKADELDKLRIDGATAAAELEEEIENLDLQQKEVSKKLAERARFATALSEKNSNEARLAEATTQFNRLGNQSETLTIEISRLPQPPTAAIEKENGNLASATEALQKWSERLRFLESAIADRQGQLKSLADTEEGLKTAEEAHRRHLLLANDFQVMRIGWDDVRIAKIAKACPMVEDHACDLLSGYEDGRFLIRLPTEEETKDGKGTKETFAPRIIDTWAEEGKREKVSGGETELCGEALRAGIAVANTQLGGHAVKTAWRDEAVGGLDEDTASYYIAMLQRMRKIAEVEQVIFITHSPRIWASATRRIFLKGGRIAEIN